MFLYVPALGEEGSEHDCTGSLQTCATEIRCCHGGLNGDRRKTGRIISSEGQAFQRVAACMRHTEHVWALADGGLLHLTQLATGEARLPARAPQLREFLCLRR